jgi:beta-lactam-binding protein with PASTA domain
VWYQSLGAGAEISDGTSITLKYVPVSTVTVPDFVSPGTLTKDLALATYGNLLTITFADDPTYVTGKEGTVVAQSVVAGTTVPAGTAITLNTCPQPPAAP